MVGLQDVAEKRSGGYSLGKGQHLGIASAPLGHPGQPDPDEPVNGLDPQGIRWIRELPKDFAVQGRTVLGSSHLMSELVLTADHVIVVGRGEPIADMPMAELIAQASTNVVLVRSPHADRLAGALVGSDVTVTGPQPGDLEVTGLSVA